MTGFCKNCYHSACFVSGFSCFKDHKRAGDGNIKRVENESTCNGWKPRKKHTKEEIENAVSTS